MSVYRVPWTSTAWIRDDDPAETTPPTVTVKIDDISTCSFETKELIFALEDRIWIEDGAFVWGGVVQSVEQTKAGWQVKGVDFLQNLARKKVGTPDIPKIYDATYTDFTLIADLLANVTFPSAPASWLKLKLTTALTGTSIAPVSYTGTKALDIIQEFSKLNAWHYYVRQTAWNVQPELVILTEQTTGASIATFPSVSDWKRESSRQNLLNSFIAKAVIKDIPENNAWLDNPTKSTDHVIGWCGIPSLATNAYANVGGSPSNMAGIVFKPNASGKINKIAAFIKKQGTVERTLQLDCLYAEGSGGMTNIALNAPVPISIGGYYWLALAPSTTLTVQAGRTYSLQLRASPGYAYSDCYISLLGMTQSLMCVIYGGGTFWSEADCLKFADIVDARASSGTNIWSGVQMRDDSSQQLLIPHLLAWIGAGIWPSSLGWTTATSQEYGYHYAAGKRGLFAVDTQPQSPRSYLGLWRNIGRSIDLTTTPKDFEYLEFDVVYLNYYVTPGRWSAIELRDSSYVDGNTHYLYWILPATGPQVSHYRLTADDFVNAGTGVLTAISSIKIPLGAIFTNLRFVGRNYSKTVIAANPAHDRYQTEFEEEESVPFQKPSVVDTYAASVLDRSQSASQIISGQTKVTTPPSLLTFIDVDLPIAELANVRVSSDTIVYLSTNAIRDFAINDYIHVGQGTVRKILAVGANYLQLDGAIGVNMDAHGPVFKRFTLCCYGYERNFSTGETKLFMDGIPWSIYTALNDMNQRLNRAMK